MSRTLSTRALAPLRALAAVALLASSAVAAPRFVELPLPCAHPAWQPGGDRLACTLDEPRGNVSRAGLLILGADAKERGFVLGASGPFAWSPDGKRIAAGTQRMGGTRLYFVDAEGGNGVVAELSEQLDALAWMPDGHEVWYSHPAILAQGRTDIAAVTPDGTPTSIAGADGFCADCASPAFAADGRIAYLRKRDVVVTDRREGHREEKTFAVPPTKDPLGNAMPLVAGPSFSPDGRWLAAVMMSGPDGGTLLLADTRAAGARWKPLGPSTGDVAWSPDGKELATCVEPTATTGKIVAVRVADGKRRDLVVPDAGCRAIAPAWSRAGVAVMHGCAGGVKLRIYRAE